MINQIKKKLFTILSVDLGYNVVDNPERNRTFPCVFLKLGNLTRDIFNNNAFRYSIKMKIDIFSNYDGEKEILEMEKAIFDKIPQLYEIDGITYIRESDFRILDDKSTGVMRKHGIITYTILSAGMLEVDGE